MKIKLFIIINVLNWQSLPDLPDLSTFPISVYNTRLLQRLLVWIKAATWTCGRIAWPSKSTWLSSTASSSRESASSISTRSLSSSKLTWKKNSESGGDAHRTGFGWPLLTRELWLQSSIKKCFTTICRLLSKCRWIAKCERLWLNQLIRHILTIMWLFIF